ncbi:MAG: ABC transporter ATP-binding protein [Nannocystaceae bacterium]
MTAAHATPLRCEGLGREVAGRTLYRDLDAAFPPSTVTAIVGPNGAGKSTLLRDLAGLRRPQRGDVRLGDAPVSAQGPLTRARALAYLPQSTPLAYDLSVAEVVMLGRTPFLARFAGPGAEDHAAVERALDRVGLRVAASRPLSSLSGGERQRVMLARMLATEAPVLLLDEPTAALDVGHALAFMDLCRELADGGRAVVAALHDLDLARRSADAALVVGARDGAVAVGTAAQVLTPQLLGPLFAVDILERDGHLLFTRSLRT